MTFTTLSSRELNQDVGRAKRAAAGGPVIITDRGRPAHVLLTIDAYRRLAGQTRSLVDAISMPSPDCIEFDAPRANVKARDVEFD